MPRRPTAAPPPSNPRFDAYDFLQDEKEDRRPLQGAIAVAVVLHIALLIVNFPNWQSRAEPPEPPERRIFVIQQPKFKPPPPPTEAPPPKPQTRPVPMPDPTPDEPEPIPVEEPPQPDIEPVVDTLFLDGLEPPAPPEPKQTGPIKVGGNVAAPVRVHYVEPRYTELARRARIQGAVIVQLVVDERGDVADIKVLKGLGMGLTEEVVKAVRQWRFEAATLNGKPVAVYYNLTVHMGLS